MYVMAREAVGYGAAGQAAAYDKDPWRASGPIFLVHGFV
jgi:hypothetical protein